MSLLSFPQPAPDRPAQRPGPIVSDAVGSIGPAATIPVDASAGEAVATTPPMAVSVGLRLSFESHIIALALFHTRLLQLPGLAPPQEEDLEALFRALSVPAREAYYAAAEVAILRLDTDVHSRALATAEAIVPGFVDGLEMYHAALRFAPHCAQPRSDA